MHASDTGELSFDEVRVPAENVLGEVGKGFYHISWELQGERMVAAAGCVAGAERMFERTLEYAKEREAFGRPIGKFQAIRHKFAEMATKIEAAKQFNYVTAWRFANGEYPVREITMVKLFASRIGCEVADECVQILGGYGYMKEYEIERAYRDVRLNRIGAGTDEIMLDVIGRSYGPQQRPRPRSRPAADGAAGPPRPTRRSASPRARRFGMGALGPLDRLVDVALEDPEAAELLLRLGERPIGGDGLAGLALAQRPRHAARRQALARQHDAGLASSSLYWFISVAISSICSGVTSSICASSKIRDAMNLI